MPYATGCHRCGGELGPDDGTCCAACSKLRREQEAARREECREKGLCLVCREPVVRTKQEGLGAGKQRRVRKPARYCAKHLAYYAARARAAG